MLISHLAIAEMRFLVLDQNGNPLHNAVLEVISDPLQSGQNDTIGIVDQIDKTFVPELAIIQKGQFVDFPNSDNIRHHVYSFSPTKTFEIKLYADQPEDPLQFDQNGVVVMGCNIHDSMVGYVYVANDRRVSKTDTQGITHLDVTSAISTISAWHADNSKGPEHREILQVNDLQKSLDQLYFIVNLDVTPPPPRDTFKDTFRAIIEQ